MDGEENLVNEFQVCFVLWSKSVSNNSVKILGKIEDANEDPNRSEKRLIGKTEVTIARNVDEIQRQFRRSDWL